MDSYFNKRVGNMSAHRQTNSYWGRQTVLSVTGNKYLTPNGADNSV